MGCPALIPILRYIKITITTPVFLYIFLPVAAGADDVFIQFSVSGSQTAGTAHISVALFIFQERGQEIKNPFSILVEKIALGFLDFFQHGLELFTSFINPGPP